MIQINLAAGHTDDDKRALLTAVSDAVVNSIGARPSSVRVWINEIAPTELMVAGEMLVDTRARTGAAT
jgi:4-oxalocrotonate tautomerase family enzyme